LKLLGISTASKVTSAGLIDGNKVVAEFTSSDIRSEDLVVLIDKIFEETGQNINDVEAIAVAQGPGSYSGLRGGLAAAKSFAQVLNIPVVGVSTLEAIAYNLVGVKGTIAVIMDAVKDEVNFAMFTSDSKQLRRITEDFAVSVTRLKEVLGRIEGELHIISNIELDGEYKNTIVRGIPSGINVAMIGAGKISSGAKSDLLKLYPEYSHTPKLKEYTK